MTVSETFRIPAGGGPAGPESVTGYGPATVRTKDIRPARRVATTDGPGPG